EKVARGMWWVKHPDFPNLNAIVFPYRADAPSKPVWKMPVAGLYWDFESWLAEPISALKITEERKATILAAAGSGELKKLEDQGWIIVDTLRTDLAFSEGMILAFMDKFLAAAARADAAAEAL